MGAGEFQLRKALTRIALCENRVQMFQNLSSIRLDTEPTERRRPDKTETYVSQSRIDALESLNSAKYDFTKLIQLCRELNSALEADAFYSIAMYPFGDPIPLLTSSRGA